VPEVLDGPEAVLAELEAMRSVVESLSHLSPEARRWVLARLGGPES
jgi:hypothetical protein